MWYSHRQDREQALFRRCIPITDEDLPYSKRPVILTWSVLWRLWYSSNFCFNYAPKWTVSSQNFQKFSGEELTEPPPQTLPPLCLGLCPGFGLRPRFSGASRPRLSTRNTSHWMKNVCPPMGWSGSAPGCIWSNALSEKSFEVQNKISRINYFPISIGTL